ncbi:hypothetical protein H0A36_07010 [Endozoicomonas sp. SM1973]|uniref:Uncharacterized protein n=1 Tax=Spartinivicinus marinus TaxID=2994442 RepID=A0A853I4Y0_9GAMM|nr:hypothetical protein [Spartinivicinus marinus]MCX4025765.1 hypothetical protein [Spartinivicinus marinus]NYZ65758.1 hypothetical protein [Spartinivicinus marinus]
MSRQVSIDITLVSKETRVNIIKRLISNGWTFSYYGEVSYLPIGDEDFDWCYERLNNKQTLKLLSEKEEAEELIGVVLTWQNTDVGGEILFNLDLSMSFVVSINRKTIGNCNSVTDMNWYLTKIIPFLESANTKVECINFEEYI